MYRQTIHVRPATWLPAHMTAVASGRQCEPRPPFRGLRGQVVRVQELQEGPGRPSLSRHSSRMRPCLRLLPPSSTCHPSCALLLRTGYSDRVLLDVCLLRQGGTRASWHSAAAATRRCRCRCSGVSCGRMLMALLLLGRWGAQLRVQAPGHYEREMGHS